MARRSTWPYILPALILPTMLLLLSLLRGDVIIRGMGDDAFFFVRYGYNFIRTGVFAWNPGEPPSFGSTSQLYQVFIAALLPLFPKSEIHAVVVVPNLMGALTVLLLLYEVLHYISAYRAATREPSSRIADVAAVIFAAIAIGFNPKFLGHWSTGMETTTSTAGIALLLVLMIRFESSPRFAMLGLPLLNTVLFWLRPDLLLIGGMPIGLAVLSGDRATRRSYLVALAVTAAMVGLTMLVWLRYYGSPAPLAAFVKTALTGYSVHAVSTYSYGNVPELFLLFREDCVLFICVGYLLLRQPFQLQRYDVALLAGAGMYILFQMFGNKIPITSGGARFLIPALPLLVWYATRGFHRLLLDTARGETAPIKIGSSRSLAVVLIAAVALLQLPPLVSQQLKNFRMILSPRVSDAAAIALNAKEQGKWAIFESISDGGFVHCSVADTEVGAIGVAPLSRTVYDFSGLNNTRLALRQQRPDDYLVEVAPDIIWYERIDFYWGTDLAHDPRLLVHYDFAPALGIAVRRDSDCAAVAGMPEQTVR